MKTRTFKTAMLAFAALIMNSMVIMAQPPQGRPCPCPPPVPDSMHVSKMISDLKTELSLSKEQTEQVKTLFATHFKEVKAKLHAEKVRREKNREEMETLRSTFENQLKAVFSPQQKQKFADFQKKHDPRRDFERRPE